MAKTTNSNYKCRKYSFGGGVAVGSILGGYLGYKIGRARPQKAGFETEKKIGRKLKQTAKDVRGKRTSEKVKAYAKGGYATGGKLTTLSDEDIVLVDTNKWKIIDTFTSIIKAKNFGNDWLEEQYDKGNKDAQYGVMKYQGWLKQAKIYFPNNYAKGGGIDYTNPIVQYDIRKAKENSREKNIPYVVVYDPINDSTENMSESYWNRTKKTQPKGTKIVFTTNKKYRDGGKIQKGDIVNYRGVEYKVKDLGTSGASSIKELRDIPIAYLTETNSPKNKNVKRDVVYSKDISVTLDNLKAQTYADGGSVKSSKEYRIGDRILFNSYRNGTSRGEIIRELDDEHFEVGSGMGMAMVNKSEILGIQETPRFSLFEQGGNIDDIVKG